MGACIFSNECFCFLQINESRSRIAGSCGSSIITLLKNLHTVFHSGYINLHSHQLWPRDAFFLHPHQHLLFIVFFCCCCCCLFLVIAILTDARWDLIVVVSSDVEHPSMKPDLSWSLTWGYTTKLQWSKHHDSGPKQTLRSME